MKFLHTADWQVGMKALHLGEAGPKVREERLAAGRRVVEAARREGAEFLLVAGDTFEDNAVDRVLVQRVADILSAFGGPVYLLPGNHDPLAPGSVWEHPAWKAANLHVLRETQALAIPGGLLFPCPVFEKHSMSDPTAWIRPCADAKNAPIHIGLAHGTVQGIRQDEPDYPIRRDAAATGGLDYLALGHWHSTTRYASDGTALRDDASGGEVPVRMAYSGTPEPTAFGERESGQALCVEIAGRGAPVRATPVRTGRLRWIQREDELASGSLDLLFSGIEALHEPENTLLNVKLRGLYTAQDLAALKRLRDILDARFFFNKVDESALRPSPEDLSWTEAVPSGVLRLAAERLRRLSDPLWNGTRPEGCDSVTASRALLALYSLVSEVPQ